MAIVHENVVADLYDPGNVTDATIRHFYGEITEWDLIPEATDEDYKNLPTYEELNKREKKT